MMKRILYIGLEPPKQGCATVIHCPLIEIVPRNNPDVEKADEASHIIVTSKMGARLLFQACPVTTLLQKTFLAIGKATAKTLRSFGVHKLHVAQEECQEGLIALIESLKLTSPIFFWGHSSLARPELRRYFEEQNVTLHECVLYETHFKKPPEGIRLDEVDEIFFSSPSTVQAFFHFFGQPPKNARLSTQGPVTKRSLDEHLLVFNK